MLIAAAARLAEPDLLILDEPTNYLDLSNINTLERWLELDPAPADADGQPRPRIPAAQFYPHHLPARRRHPPLQPASRIAREALLHRDAATRAPKAGGQRDQAAGEGRRPIQGLGSEENPDIHKRATAIETRIERLGSRPHEELCRARERRLELTDGAMDAKIALRLAGLDSHDARRPQAVHVDRLTIATGDRIAVLGANGVGKSTLLTAIADAYDPDLEHYDGTAPIRFNPVLPPGVLRPAHAGPAGDPAPSSTMSPAPRVPPEGGHPSAGQGRLRLRRLREPIASSATASGPD